MIVYIQIFLKADLIEDEILKCCCWLACSFLVENISVFSKLTSMIQKFKIVISLTVFLFIFTKLFYSL